MTRTKKKTRHTKSVFRGAESGEPSEIEATESGIAITFYMTKDGPPRGLVLRPEHILAITSMNHDWWDDFWAELYEKEA